LAVVIGLNGIMTATKAARLRLLLGRRPSFGACFLAKVTTSAINNVTPFRGGDVARVWMLERHAGITKSVAAVVALVEHLLELLALSALATVAARALVPEEHWAGLMAPVVLAVTVVVLVLVRRVGGGARMPAPSPPQGTGVGARVRALIVRIEPGVRALHEPGTTWVALGLSFAAWGLEALMIMLCARAISLPLDLPLAIIVLLGINAAMALPSMPASAGAFEAGVTLVLVLSGVPKSAAIGFAVLYHLVQVVPVTLAGATVIFRVGFTLDGLRRRGLGGGSVRAAEPDRKQFDSGTDKPPGTGGSFPWDGPSASHEPVLCQKSIEENIHESVALSRATSCLLRFTDLVRTAVCRPRLSLGIFRRFPPSTFGTRRPLAHQNPGIGLERIS
jgi:uncharacterized protein (TIRG00374 family)